MKRSTLRIVLLGAACFVAGAALGAGGVTRYAVRQAKEIVNATPQERVARLGDRLDKRLELTEAQRERIQPHLETLVAETSAWRREARRALSPVFETVLAEIRSSLDPAQATEFDELLGGIRAILPE